MKNFTNNFKQFTSRLSARWLIMALMMLVGTSSVWAADVYITTTSTNSIKFYTWNNSCNSDDWPGVTLVSSATKNDNANGGGFYKFPASSTCSDNSYNYIINGSGGQTGDLSLTSTTWGVYDAKSFSVLMTEANMSSKSITFRSDSLSGWSTNTSTTWDATKKKYKTAEVNYSKQSGIDVYIAGTKFIYKAPANFGTPATGNYIIYWDPYTSNITFETPCPTSVTPGTASGTTSICSGGSAEITLTGYTEDATIQWQKSATGSLNDFTDITGATSPTYTASDITATTYFRAKVTIPASGTCNAVTGYSDYVTVSLKSAPTKPDITLNPADGNIISGNSATLSVNNPVDGYTYTLYETTRGEIESGMTSFTISDAGNYYVKATNDCQQESPASEEKEITVCTIGSTLNSAEYDAATQKVSLEGTFEFCGKESFHGFQWKKVGSKWCDENVPTDNSDYVKLDKTTEGGTKSGEYTIEDQNSAYVFRTYVVPVGGAWIYGNDITVTPCITVATPNVTAEAICLGEEATLTLSNKQDNVVYELDGVEIFKIGNTHTVKPDRTTTYAITATSTNSCVANQTETTTVEVEVYELPDAPTINEETTVCPNTPFTLPTIDGDGNWYAQAKGGNAYASTTINGITETTYYYAEAVKYGCASATRTQYTVNVHTTPVAPVISLNPATVGQDKNSVLSISNETYSPSNTKYELYKGSEKVGEMTAQTTNVSSSNVGDVIYSVKATHKECTALTSTSNEVTLKVQEAGAIIAALGDLKVDPQDPVDFVAMYVKNDGLAYYTDQGATKVTGYTWQFNDGTGWKDCASTNTAAGVDYDVLGMENGSSKCNNFRPNVRGEYRCKVTYDVGEQTSNVLTVTADATTEQTFKGVSMTLPVISVNTGGGDFPVNDFGGTPSKNASSDKMKAKISVDVKIFDKGAVVYDRKARMNYRGSSSMNFLKKSYAFVTGKEKTKNDKGDVDTGKANLLGVGNAEDKDWVLYAAAADPSLMRNRLMFDTFRDMTGGWSVNSRYVELVVNGKYKGVYVLMDKITANEKRVNVAWKQDINGNTTQEGFIVKFDKTDIVDRYEITSGDQKTFKSTYSGHDGLDTYDTQIDQRFEIEYPEKEDIEEEDLDNNKGAGDWSVVFNSIKDKFNKFEKELKAGNFTEVQKLIDYTSWADWFIITEFGKNIDGYRASNFFVYDGSKANAKIEARPLWDQELSFNNQCPGYYNDYAAASTSGLLIKDVEKVYTDNCSAPFWFTGRYIGGRGTYNGSNQQFKGLLDDPCFVAEVQARWAIHTGANGALTSNALTTKMKGYLADLDKDHVLNSSTITTGTPLDREINIFWKNKSRSTIDCGTGSKCFGDNTTGYTDQGFHSSKTNLNNWLTGNRRTNLGNIINGWEGTGLNISLTVTPDGGEITPWEAVMVQVNNPSGYEYDLEYTTGELNKVSGVIIKESNDKYTYRIPRPADWGYGNGERADVEYGIKATLKVAEGEAQCGNSTEAPTATATIKLTDEEDDANCEIK